MVTVPEAMLRAVIVLGPVKPVVPALKTLAVPSSYQPPVAERVPLFVSVEMVLREMALVLAGEGALAVKVPAPPMTTVGAEV